MIHNDSAVTHQSLVVFWFKHYQKNYFSCFFFFFLILKVYISFQIYCFIISAPLRIALQQPWLPDSFQGQVSRKATRGCRRLRRQCESPAAANWIHFSLQKGKSFPAWQEQKLAQYKKLCLHFRLPVRETKRNLKGVTSALIQWQ